MASRKSKVIALALGKGLSQIVGVAIGMLLARWLSKTDVAAYRQTFLAYATVVPILSLGIGQGIYYFVPTEKERVRGRVLDGLCVLGFMGALFAIFLACGGNQLLASRFSNPKVAKLLFWMIPFAIITTPAGVTESVLVARENASWAALFGVGRQLFIGILTIIPLWLWRNAEAAIVGNFAASILMALAAFWLIHQALPKNEPLRASAGGIYELVKFTVPISLATMIATISLQLDKLIVSVMCTPDEFAVYSFGAIEIPMIGMITGAITSVMLVDMKKCISEDRGEEAIRLFRLTAEKSSLFILPAMAFFMIVGETALTLMFTAEYAESVVPFRWYLSLLPIRTVVFGSMLIALGKSRFILFRSVIGLSLNLALSALLVWQLGSKGAVISTVAVIYFWSVPANLFVIGRSMKRSWLSIFPLAEIARVALGLVPIILVALGIVLVIHDPVIEFAVVASAFGVFLMFYWNEKLYSISKFLNSTRMRA